MKLEHLAFNVSDPLSMARWYCEHLGLTIRRRAEGPSAGHFLADDSGTVLIEIYSNKGAPNLHWPDVHPSSLHLAFLSNDVAADVKRLVSAGASIVADTHTLPAGDTVAMLRDPWGLPVQFVNRRVPMITRQIT